MSDSSGRACGWVYHCVGGDNWTRRLCKASVHTLGLYRESMDKEPVVSISLAQASLREVTLFGLLSRGVVGHSAGFIIKTEASREESPRAVAEVRDNGLDNKRESSDNSSATEIILAAEDADDHVTWRRYLSSLCASATLLTSQQDGHFAQRPPSTLPKPPASLLQWLCRPGCESGRDLVARLHDARSGLLTSFKESNIISQDPIQVVQPVLNELQACLLGLIRTLQEENFHAERAAIDETHAWLQSAVNFAASYSAFAFEALVQHNGLGSASHWQTVAEAAAAELQGAEDVFLAEMARQKRAKLAEDVENGLVHRNRLLAGTGYIRPSAKPYATFWAKKIAI